MYRQKVHSSNLVFVGYDDENQMLEIEFKEGKVYSYSDVPRYIYESLMSANSKGKYFRENIMNKYKWPNY